MANQETRECLVDAFFSIYQKKPISKITIREVTEKAGFHRVTFYEYFTDIYDLLEQEEEEIYKLQKSLILLPVGEGKLSLKDYGILEPLQKLFELKGDKLAVLIGSNGDPTFRRTIQERIKLVIIPEFQGKHDLEKEYMAEFISSGVLSVFERAFREQEDMEELMKKIYPLVSKVLPREI